MKKVAVFIAFSILLLVGTAGVAAAQADCRETCHDSKGVCSDSARTAVKGCRMLCRSEAPSDRRTCSRACRADLKEARSTCRGSIEECRDTCSAEIEVPAETGDGGVPTDPWMCMTDCKQDLRQCSRPVLEAGEECSVACFELRREESRECRGSSNPLRCILGTFGNFGRCLSGCAQDTHAAGRACLDGFRDCRQGCESPNPYGSASQAFLSAPASLMD